MPARQKRQRLLLPATHITYIPPPVLQIVLGYLLDGKTEAEKAEECLGDMLKAFSDSLTDLASDRLFRFMYPIRINEETHATPAHMWKRCNWVLHRLCHINRRTMSHAFVGFCECELKIMEREEERRLRCNVHNALQLKRACYMAPCLFCRPLELKYRWPVNIPPVEIIFCSSYFLRQVRGQQRGNDGVSLAYRLLRRGKLQWFVIVG